MLNLDTHILVHALNGQLPVKEREVLANDQWGISAIVIWELAKLVQLGRIDLDIDSAISRGRFPASMSGRWTSRYAGKSALWVFEAIPPTRS
jgi:predicted nucleic acid-binding protein